MKVTAGRILTVAAAKVADVYWIPTPYKFWSSTGLQIFYILCYFSFYGFIITYMLMKLNKKVFVAISMHSLKLK